MNMKERKQIFLSHTWEEDDLGRNTHHRARDVVHSLCSMGWTVWFDEADMGRHNMDAEMACGIDDCSTVVLLITRAYARKVNRAARKQSISNDNCLKEFNYAMFREKKVIPVVFEESMRNSNQWSPGVLPFRLNMSLYVDGTKDERSTAAEIDHAMRRNGELPTFANRRKLSIGRREKDYHVANHLPTRRAPRLELNKNTVKLERDSSQNLRTKICAMS